MNRPAAKSCAVAVSRETSIARLYNRIGAARCRLVWVVGLIGVMLLAGAVPAWSASFRWSASSHRIYVTGPGRVRLSNIDAALQHASLQQVSPGVWHLRSDLQIEKGAVLELYGTEIGGDVNVLRLQSNNSEATNRCASVTADWGSIDIRNCKITSWDDVADGPDTEYDTYQRAFIRVRSHLDPDGVTPRESRMDIIDSEIGYLGFYESEAYGLSWKVNGDQPNLLDLVNVYGQIRNSRIHHNYFGVFTFGAYGMQILTNEVDHNVEYGIDPHDDSDSMLIQGNHAHSNGNHGIIASMRCDHLIIRNNVTAFNRGNGIMLHRACDDCIIEDNSCLTNSNTGIVIMDGRRTQIRNNRCLGNDQAGIRLNTGSSDNIIKGNELAYSLNHGFYIYKGADSPRDGDDGRPKRNWFANNTIHDNTGEGIRLSDGDEHAFVGNQFIANGTILRFERGASNVLDGNSLVGDVTVKTLGDSGSPGATTIRNQPRVRIQVDSYTAVIFEDEQGAIFFPDETKSATSVSTNGSVLVLTTAEIGTSSTVTTLKLRVRPDSGTAEIDPAIWNLSGDLSREWKVTAGSTFQDIRYLVGDLVANAPYLVFRNGVALQLTVTSDASGILQFNDIAGTTSPITYRVSPSGTLNERAPLVTTPAYKSGIGFSLDAITGTNRVIVFEASSDLVRWTELFRITNQSPVLSLADPKADIFAQRFYRVKAID